MPVSRRAEGPGVDYIDLYPIHCRTHRAPPPLAEANKAPGGDRGFYRAGVVKYRLELRERHLVELMKSAEIAHGQPDPPLPGSGKRSWSPPARGDGAGGVQPLGTGNLLKNETIATVAAAHGRARQISLRHLVQGFGLPKSIREETIRENLAIFDFSLTGEEMHLLDGMENSVGPPRNPDEALF